MAKNLFVPKKVKIETVKKGDFVIVGSGKTVYVYEGYSRENKKYQLQSFENNNKQRYLKKGTLVSVGFTY